MASLLKFVGFGLNALDSLDKSASRVCFCVGHEGNPGRIGDDAYKEILSKMGHRASIVPA